MKTKTFPIQSRIDKNQADRLLAIAKDKGISLSLLVRIILINYLEGKNNVL
jgi:hypothetical protein